MCGGEKILYVSNTNDQIWKRFVNKLFLFSIQNIPISAGKHLGFTWGPGDILVYETLYKASGMYGTIENMYSHVSCLISVLCQNVFKDLWVQDLPSSMK